MPDFNYSGLKFWLDVVQLLITAGIGVYVWAVTRHRVQSGRIDGIEQTVAQLKAKQADRMTIMEQRILHMPTHEDIGAVFNRLDELHGDIRELGGRMDGVSRSLHLVSEHLMRTG